MKKNIAQGFTLIEILLVIAILAILASVVIVAINPAKQFGEAQDAQRRNDVLSILNSTHQYAIDNNGLYPDTIPFGGDCMSEGLDICEYQYPCVGGINLDVLADNQLYLTDIPSDPIVGGADITGYKMLITNDGRVSVCAPSTYAANVIQVTQ